MKFLDSTADYPQAPGVVLIKVPKPWRCWSSNCALRKVVTPETRIIAGAKARYSHLDAGAVREGPRPDHHDACPEKARLINCTFQRTGAGRRARNAELETGRYRLDHPQPRERLFPYRSGYRGRVLWNICRKILRVRLSTGLRQWRDWPDAAGEEPEASVVFSDESPMAVASSRLERGN